MSQAAALDVRQIAPYDRHPVIFGRFLALQPGEEFQIINDHDPRPLYYQLQAQWPGSLVWTYIESGPDVWQVSIKKIAATAPMATAASGSCCSGGSCG